MNPIPVPGANTINPSGSPKVTVAAPDLEPPSDAVSERQDPTHTEADFVRDLAKATRQKRG